MQDLGVGQVLWPWEAESNEDIEETAAHCSERLMLWLGCWDEFQEL